MPKISELSDLFLAIGAQDFRRAQLAARRIAAAEETAGHHAAAARLRGALTATGPRPDAPAGLNDTVLVGGRPDLLDQLESASLPSVELPRSTRESLDEVLAEQRHKALLAAARLRPRSRLFFVGPPGCGKTLTARALASSLGLPCFTVRFDALVGSHLGQTGTHLREVFRFAESTPSVVLIDEIDAIARRRGRSSDVGEMDRIVISLMQQLDYSRPLGLIIAASNLPKHVDMALLRRFDIVLEFPRPSPAQLSAFIARFLAEHDLCQSARLRKELQSATTFADAERHLVDEMRRTLLQGSAVP